MNQFNIEIISFPEEDGPYNGNGLYARVKNECVIFNNEGIRLIFSPSGKEYFNNDHEFIVAIRNKLRTLPNEECAILFQGVDPNAVLLAGKLNEPVYEKWRQQMISQQMEDTSDD